MESLIWNVRYADNALEALTEVFLSTDNARKSPQCASHSWGRSLQLVKSFNQLKADVKEKHALSTIADYAVYKQKLQEYTHLFTFSKRRGYGVLTYSLPQK